MTSKLYEIISKTLNVSVSEINDDFGAETTESWDSFNVYVLLDEIETAYNIKFNLDETLEINSVKDFERLLQKHGVTQF